ncbi:hypothetical protein GO730_04120 [Spirosoma sp. HMF3257]|uniref:Porin family protein n=1 Tax=Spirosoma telluris TaxID=2183553 RepID=A0A327NMF4_9BACT|nr:hypothetical protein [Spirosoma telluris]RAI73788.1 hypothetical protein HMF3257_04080 [Spirosoma telluris]
MKKRDLLLFVLAAALKVATGMAQSNTLLVYGAVTIDSQKAGTETSSSYGFSPAIGYQWNDQWTGGINLNLAGTNYTDKSSEVAVGPFIRYTKSLGGLFAVYGQFNANSLSGKTGNISYSGFQGTLFPAIGVNLKNSFALNFTFGSLGFTSQKFDNTPNAQTHFHFGFGSGAGFGISKNFGLKK